MPNVGTTHRKHDEADDDLDEPACLAGRVAVLRAGALACVRRDRRLRLDRGPRDAVLVIGRPPQP